MEHNFDHTFYFKDNLFWVLGLLRQQPCQVLSGSEATESLSLSLSLIDVVLSKNSIIRV
jgi:hypothetical protein